MNADENSNQNPAWWTDESETAWGRVKLALERDFDQTRHDLGAHEPDTQQTARNTIRQAKGTEAIPPRGQPPYAELESAHRFGYAARLEYGAEHPVWDEALETLLKQDWERVAPARQQTWPQDRAAIRYAWEYHAVPRDEKVQ
jgi:hypothetical protein